MKKIDEVVKDDEDVHEKREKFKKEKHEKLVKEVKECKITERQLKEAESDSDDDDLPVPVNKDQTIMDKITKNNKLDKIKSLA